MVKSKNVGTRGVRLGLDVSTAASSWKLRDGAKHPSNPGSLSAIAIGSGSIPSPFTACMVKNRLIEIGLGDSPGRYVLRAFPLGLLDCSMRALQRDRDFPRERVCRVSGKGLSVDDRWPRVTSATRPATPQGVEKQSAFWWPCRKTLMTEAPTPLAPEEEVELDRLCEEYRVATASVRKNMRFGNPPDPGVVPMFVESEAGAAAILARIKQILGV